MNKLLLLGAMLALMAVAAIPALAQQKTGSAGGESRGSVAANPTPSADRSHDGAVSYSADPADGSSDVLVSAPTGADEISVPLPEGGPGDGCAGMGSLASAPADEGGGASGSVTLASEPGCDYVSVAE